MKRALLRNIFNEEQSTHEKKFKFINERIGIVDKHVPNLRNKFNDLINKTVTKKKSILKIASILNSFAHIENISSSFGGNLQHLSEIVTEYGNEDQALATALHDNVVQQLADFGKQCKHLRSDLKAAVTASDRESIRKRQLQRLDMLRDQDQERVSVAESEYLKAKRDSVKAVKAVEEHADIFEQRKLKSIRTALMEWVALEIQYHARSLELCTDAYNIVAGIDVDTDLQEYREKLYNIDHNNSTRSTSSLLSNSSNGFSAGLPVAGMSQSTLLNMDTSP